MSKKRIAILGSTGSIGEQALEVISQYPDMFEVEVLTANTNANRLIEQALLFNPNAVVIADTSKYLQVKNALSSSDIKVFSGEKSLEDIVEMESIDMVLIALVGFSGLLPTIRAIEYHKNIALANKETLVAGGSLVSQKAIDKRVSILPVDSEHSAIFQCLVGESHNPIEKIILTASGGPFRGKSTSFLENVKIEDALRHPNWSMGRKITIDSATLMNKGFEVIEAGWLFDLKPEQIEVVVHPQSIIHSMVQFEDGSIKAQMGLPNMRLPILYAFSFPKRYHSDLKRCNLLDYAQLSFEKPDTDTFPCLSLAYHAMTKGGNLPCIMNAANEMAVEAFLKGKLSFLGIADFIEKRLFDIPFIQNPSIDDLIHTDKEVREKSLEKIY